MLYWNIDPLEALREKGYTTYKLENAENPDFRFSAETLHALRKRRRVAWVVLDRLCEMLDCQPSDLLRHEKMYFPCPDEKTISDPEDLGIKIEASANGRSNSQRA